MLVNILNHAFDQHQQISTDTLVFVPNDPKCRHLMKELKEECDQWYEFSYEPYLWEKADGDMMKLDDVSDSRAFFVNSGYSGYQGGNHWWRCTKVVPTSDT